MRVVGTLKRKCSGKKRQGVFEQPAAIETFEAADIETFLKETLAVDDGAIDAIDIDGTFDSSENAKTPIDQLALDDDAIDIDFTFDSAENAKTPIEQLALEDDAMNVDVDSAEDANKTFEPFMWPSMVANSLPPISDDCWKESLLRSCAALMPFVVGDDPLEHFTLRTKLEVLMGLPTGALLVLHEEIRDLVTEGSQVRGARSNQWTAKYWTYFTAFTWASPDHPEVEDEDGRREIMLQLYHLRKYIRSTFKDPPMRRRCAKELVQIMEKKLNLYRVKAGRFGKTAKKLDKADVQLRVAEIDGPVVDRKFSRLKEAMRKNHRASEKNLLLFVEYEKETRHLRNKVVKAGCNAVQAGYSMLGDSPDSPACAQTAHVAPVEVAPAQLAPAKVAPLTVSTLESERCLPVPSRDLKKKTGVAPAKVAPAKVCTLESEGCLPVPSRGLKKKQGLRELRLRMRRPALLSLKGARPSLRLA